MIGGFFVCAGWGPFGCSLARIPGHSKARRLHDQSRSRHQTVAPLERLR